MTEHDKRTKYHAKIMATRNLKHEKWAVSLVRYHGWQRDSAIGDGITSALEALVTRCETEDEASEIANTLNSLEPGVLPGSKDAREFAALPYEHDHYIPKQNLDRGQDRDCDRRICGL